VHKESLKIFKFLNDLMILLNMNNWSMMNRWFRSFVISFVDHSISWNWWNSSSIIYYLLVNARLYTHRLSNARRNLNIWFTWLSFGLLFRWLNIRHALLWCYSRSKGNLCLLVSCRCWFLVNWFKIRSRGVIIDH
jgi:hypothetical protein